MALPSPRDIALLAVVAVGGCMGTWKDKWSADTGAGTPIPLHPRCTTTAPEALSLPAPQRATFVIGTLFDHTDPDGVAGYESVQVALDQVNEGGGLDGRTFAAVHCTNQEDPALDDLDSTAAAVDVADWLATRAGVHALVGPTDADDALAVYTEVAEPTGTVVVSPRATSVALSAIDGLVSTDDEPGLFWRTAAADDAQGAAIAWDMTTQFDPLGAEVYRRAPSSDVGVVFQSGAYADGVLSVFAAAMTAAGATTRGYGYVDDASRATAIGDAANGGHDELLFIGGAADEVAAFLVSATALPTLDDVPLFVTDRARHPDFLEAAASARARFPQVRGVSPAPPSGPTFDAYAAAHAARFAATDLAALPSAAASFDAAWLVCLGHAWGLYQHGEVSGHRIAQGLRRVSLGRDVPLRATSWSVLRAAFEEGNSVDVDGASGPLDYDEAGETTALTEVWVITPPGDGFEGRGTYAP